MAAPEIRIELLAAPGCARCALAHDRLRSAAQEVGGERVAWRDVDVLKEIDYAVTLGLVAPPAIAIDGEIVFSSLPSEAELRAEVAARLAPAGAKR